MVNVFFIAVSLYLIKNVQDTNNEDGCQGIRRVSAKTGYAKVAIAEVLEALAGRSV